MPGLGDAGDRQFGTGHWALRHAPARQVSARVDEGPEAAVRPP